MIKTILSTQKQSLNKATNFIDNENIPTATVDGKVPIFIVSSADRSSLSDCDIPNDSIVFLLSWLCVSPTLAEKLKK